MKKTRLPLSSIGKASGFLLISSTAAFSELIVYEGFDYIEAEPIIAAGDASQGWAGAWDGVTSIGDGSGRTAAFTVIPELTFESLETTGGATQRDTRFGNESISRTISAASQTALTADDSTMWFSVLMSGTGTPAVGGDGAGFATNTYATIVFGDAALNGGRGIGASLISNGGNAFGVSFGDTSDDSGNFANLQIQGVSYSGGALTQSVDDRIVVGEAVSLIVGKIDWAPTGSDDTLTLYNVTDLAAGLPEAFTTMTGDFDQSTFNLISIGDAQTSIFDEIRIGESFADVSPNNIPVTPVSIAPTLCIAQSNDALNFEWESTAGNAYDLLSSTDLSIATSEWAIYDDGSGPIEDIAASDTGTNTLSGIARVGEVRFFALREEELLPTTLLSADFESDGGGFVANAAPAGSSWEFGSPDANGPRGTIINGSGSSSNAWGTRLGDDEDLGSMTSGQYLFGTVAFLSTPVIDLSSFSGSATLNFDENLDFPAADTAEVYLIDNATNTEIGTGPIYTAIDPDLNATGWNSVPEIALGAEALGKQVRIEFRFSGNGAPQSDYLGWYIDNVVVEAL